MTTLAPNPPAAGLPTATLAGIVHSIVSRPGVWRPLAVEPETERVARLLMRDEQLEVWVISWGSGHDTGFHDHGGSVAAVAVAAGGLVEERLRLDGPPVARTLRAGDPPIPVPAEHVHRVHHPGSTTAVSVHAYSPPLSDLGAYRVGRAGVLERITRPSSTMLEPLASERTHESASAEEAS